MPKIKSGLLTEREKELLKNPEEFDSQTRAEIRYSIRQKWEELEEDLELLEEKSDNWAKKEDLDKFFQNYIVFECRMCGKKDLKKRYSYSHGLVDNTIEDIQGWKYEIIDSARIKEHDLDESITVYQKMKQHHQERITGHPMDPDFEDRLIKQAKGFCPECLDKQETIETAKQNGMVPCCNSKCNTHKIGSNPFNEHINYIPISDSQIEELKSMV